MMSKISLDIPEQSLPALKLGAADAGETLRLVAAIKLYELGQLSSGAAAQLAGIPCVVFLTKLADYGAYNFCHSEDELQREAQLY